MKNDEKRTDSEEASSSGLSDHLGKSETANLTELNACGSAARRIRILNIVLVCVLVLILIAAIPTFAWLSFRKNMAVYAPISTPESLYIGTGQKEDITYLYFSEIDVKSSDHKDFVISICGEGINMYKLQLGYTTNNQFEYQLFNAVGIPQTFRPYDGEIDVPRFQIVAEQNDSGAYFKLDQSTGSTIYLGSNYYRPYEEGDTSSKRYDMRVTENDLGAYVGCAADDDNLIISLIDQENAVRYEPNGNSLPVTFYTIDPARPGALAGSFLNKASADEIVANDAYHDATYAKGAGHYDNVHKYAEPLYWQTDSAISSNGGHSFVHYYILRIQWDPTVKVTNDRETDVICIAANVV